MENTVIKKRLNTYKSEDGRLNRVDDEVVLDVLRAWENWQGSTADLYRDLGLSKMQLVTMIQKGKKLVKKGAVSGSGFKEISVSKVTQSLDSGYGIEVSWEQGRLIRFKEVSQVVEFLKQASKNDNV